MFRPPSRSTCPTPLFPYPSPCRSDVQSTPTTPPVPLLRAAADGRTLATVARADITRLKAAGWVPPVPITVTARDGKTELYGMMFKPSHFDASKKYPIIDYIYPGPQTGSVRGRNFSAARSDHQAMAELDRKSTRLNSSH